ncbi:MAG: hypothetical protein ACLFU2_06820 [Opitutales bacterium]
MMSSRHGAPQLLSPQEVALQLSLPRELPALGELPTRSSLAVDGRAPDLGMFKAAAREAWGTSPETLLAWLQGMHAGGTGSMNQSLLSQSRSIIWFH